MLSSGALVGLRGLEVTDIRYSDGLVWIAFLCGLQVSAEFPVVEARMPAEGGGVCLSCPFAGSVSVMSSTYGRT